ncbi:hypothetical protein [Vibrio anguillarum]|uniref:Uncharacterized protein n=28 Tax=Vibrio anguillarum TaxID=55601 RepID=A0AAW4AEJ5_VIBAN|nr:hypothetical protein [Vibrio anguillarum]ASF94139.1 hypothetical protein CEA93_19385 [Vibrio anguillarum]MBF4214822.1 hypothetical protein [Vibrio anguillarum]MBF4221510.1 hypothetical protein [Vibrio anguillarum]MBF4226392.1 hypothetical protein [Vibrio anguillarum]MBF4231044.1 hypothetical protein [Vibrio anguillarum]
MVTNVPATQINSIHQDINENENGLMFNPIRPDTISAQHFVDLTSVDQPHGLKMMASIQDGKLILITGKNRGLLREMWHRRPFHHRKADYLFAPIEIPNKRITQLWIDKKQNLQAVYTDITTGNTHCSHIKLMPKLTSQGQLVVDVHTSANTEVTLGSDNTPPVTLMLKGEQEADVKIDALNNRRLSVASGKAQLAPPLSDQEYIQHIKPCGKWLQVTIATIGENTGRQRIIYLDTQHLEFRTETNALPEKWQSAVSDTPPIAFAHFAANNSSHFVNANPFVGNKVKHIGNQFVPLSGWIDGIKHRVSRGNEKWQRGRKVDAAKSYAKSIDPGLHTMALWGKQRWNHRHLPAEIVMAEQRLAKQLSLKSYLRHEWNKCFLTDEFDKDRSRLDSRLRVALSISCVGNNTRDSDKIEELTAEKLILDSLKSSEKVLDQVVITSVSGKRLMDSALKENISILNKQLSDLLLHSDAQNLSIEPIHSILRSMQNQLTTLTDSTHSSFKYKEIDLYLSYIERTLINTRLYLACQGASESIKIQTNPMDTLKHKLLNERSDELNSAIQTGCPSMKAWRCANKIHSRMAESLNNQQNGLGKVWTHVTGNQTPAHQILDQIVQRMHALPKGDALTLSAQQGLSGFAGIAHFGLPFAGGYFAGVMAYYEKHYDCKLVALGDEKTQIQFVRKKDKMATAMLGTGAGMEDIANLVKDQYGSVVTVLPFEATLALTAKKEHEQNFAFNVKNVDLSKMLGYLFKLEDGDKVLQEYQDTISHPQYTSEQTKTLKVTLAENSEVRLQRGINVSPSMFMVAPRSYIKFGADVSVARENKRVTKIGNESSLHVQTDYVASLNVCAGSGVTAMVFPLAPPYAFPTAIDEKTFATTTPSLAQHGYVTRFNQLGSHELPLASMHGINGPIDDTPAVVLQSSNVIQNDWMTQNDVSSNDLDLLQPIQTDHQNHIQLNQLYHWLNTNGTGEKQLQARGVSILTKLAIAEKMGYHEVNKEIAADKIEHLKVSYDQRIHWRCRWADNIRRHIHIRPKYSRSLSQVIGGETSATGRKFLQEIKASSQSQSQLLNAGRESFVQATAKYRLERNQLDVLTKELVEQLIRSKSTKAAHKLLAKFDQQLSRSSKADRNQFQLTEIAFQRISSMSRHPAGILPMIKVKQKSQIMMTESLGEIVFTPSSPEMDKNNTPLFINQLDPSLFSVSY